MTKEELEKELVDIDESLSEFEKEGGRACLIVGSWDLACPFYFKNDSYMKEVLINILLLHKEHINQELNKLEV